MFHQARKRIMKMLQKIINDRRGSDIHDDHGDFLQHLLMNGNGGFLTDEQLKDNILTMIIAGKILESL